MFSSPTVSSDRAWAVRMLGGLALVLLIVLVFARSFGSDLVFDSSTVISDDIRLQDFSASKIIDVFTRNYWWPTMRSNLYRPLTTFSFMVEYSVLGFKERPAPYQLNNLFLHIVTVLLTWSLLRKFGVGWAAAWFVSAWFAVHPFVVEVVPNVVGRSDLFALIAILLGLHVYLDFLAGLRKPGRSLILLACIGLFGVLAKENAVSLLGVIIWHALTLGRERLATLWRTSVIRRAHLLGALAVFSLVLGAVLVPKLIFKEPFFDVASVAGDNPLRVLPWLDARLNALAILGQNLVGCIVPLDVSADYSYNQIRVATLPISDAYEWSVLAWALGTVAFGFLGLFLLRRWPIMAFTVGAVFILLLPTANLFVIIGTIRADRLIYPAVAPMLLCVGLPVSALIVFLGRQPGSSIYRLGSLAVWGLGSALCVLGAFTHLRGTEWRTTRQFWSSMIATAPESHKAKTGWALLLSADGNLDSANEAVRLSSEAVAQVEFAKDIRIKKSSSLIEMDASVHVQRGLILVDAGRLDEARMDFAHAEATLGPLMEEIGSRNEELAREHDEAPERVSVQTLKSDASLIMLADLKRFRGDKTAARELLAKYLRFNHLVPKYLLAYGRALVDDGNWEEALAYFLQASILRPHEQSYSAEAAWVWKNHTVPPSALPMMTQQMKKGIPSLPVVDLGDVALAQETYKAATRVAELLRSDRLEIERRQFIRQVRFRVAKPNWEFAD